MDYQKWIKKIEEINEKLGIILKICSKHVEILKKLFLQLMV